MKLTVVLVLSAVSLCAAGTGRIILPRPRHDGRIVGGVETVIEDLPHQVSLQSSGSHICGASIISEDWVVTASHCVDGRTPSQLSVRAGSTKKNSGGSIHPASEIIMHENYNRLTIDWDVAVIKVSKKFVFGDSVQPIAMQRSGLQVPTGTDVVVSGWGSTHSGGASPDNLRKVTVNIIDHKKCNDDYAQHGGITERMVCAGVGGGKDSCQGDSGGPLITYNDRTLVGIVSWGAGCALPQYPGVYADVSVLRDWIEDKTGV